MKSLLEYLNTVIYSMAKREEIQTFNWNTKGTESSAVVILSNNCILSLRTKFSLRKNKQAEL